MRLSKQWQDVKMGNKKQKLLLCPDCGSSEVTLTCEQKFMANTDEHYCHSMKTHDDDSPARCLKCGWEGIRIAINGGS